MSEKPTGVFMPLPVTDEQAQEMYRAYCAAYANSPLTTRGIATQAAMLSIGTPIQDSVSIAAYLINDDEGMRAVLYTSRTEDVFPCVLQKHHQAALAPLQAEVVRLRSYLERILPKASTACHRSLSGRESRLLAGYCADAREALKGGAA